MFSAVGTLAIGLFIGTMGFGQAGAPAAPAQSPAPAPETAKPIPLRPAHRGAYLGVYLGDQAAEIRGVDQDGPAAKAGLRERDTIISFYGQKIETADELRALIRSSAPGRVVKLGISRNGQNLDLSVQLGKYPRMQAGNMQGLIPPPNAMAAMPAGPDFEIPQFAVLQFWSRSGMVVEDITRQLGEFFGVRNGEGVLVRSVEKGSAADAAGLKAGDVIVRINGARVTCSTDWRHAMRQQGGNVSLGIVRDKREQTVSIQLPARKNSGANSDFEFPGVPESNQYHFQRLKG